MDRASIVQHELEMIFNSSKETALNDGEISEEEAALLELLETKLDDLKNEILPILDSLTGTVTESDLRQRIRLVAREIIPKLTDMAKDDNIITQDEAAILSRVLKDIM